MVEDTFVTKTITLVGISGLFLLSFILLKPILLSIIVGLILAYTLFPIYKKIHKYLKNGNLSTIVLLLVILILIAVPVALLTPTLVRQTFETYNYFEKVNFGDVVQKVAPTLVTSDLSRVISVQVNNLVGKLFSSLLTKLTDLLSGLPNVLLQLAIVLFTFYFAVRDSEKLKEYFSKLSPFSESTEKKFLTEFKKITNAIVYGQVIIGLIQGIVLGIGLFILGVPNPLVLIVITMIVSMIPVLGSWLVWLPTAVVLITTGQVVSGVILLIYGTFVVSLIDNLLRPYFLSKSSQNLPLVVALIGIIGGLYAFGIIGLVLGPLILAYSIIIIDFYRQGKLNELFRK